MTTVAFISAATARLPAAEPTGVSDSGCMGVVTSTATYDHLRVLDLVPAHQPPPHPLSIRFGTTQDGTNEPVIGEVLAPGKLIDRIAVVKEVAATLMRRTAVSASSCAG